MLAEHDVGLRVAVEDPVVEHCARPGAVLLGGLDQHDERSRPFVTLGDESLDGADHRGHVHVVSAGVHDGNGRPRGVDALRSAGVRQTRLLLDRQCVHVGPHPHHRAVAVAQDADDTGDPDALFDLEAQVAQVLGGDARGARLLEREFRMLVQVDVERFEVDRHGPSLAGRQVRE